MCLYIYIYIYVWNRVWKTCPCGGFQTRAQGCKMMVFSILLFFVGGGVETIHGLKCRQVRAKHIPKPVVLDLDGLAQSRQNDPKLRQKKGDHSPKNFKHPVYLNVINSENMSLTYIPTFPNRLYHGKFASQFHLAPFFKIRR